MGFDFVVVVFSSWFFFFFFAFLSQFCFFFFLLLFKCCSDGLWMGGCLFWRWVVFGIGGCLIRCGWCLMDGVYLVLSSSVLRLLRPWLFCNWCLVLGGRIDGCRLDEFGWFCLFIYVSLSLSRLQYPAWLVPWLRDVLVLTCFCVSSLPSFRFPRPLCSCLFLDWMFSLLGRS